ncbi:hypothetical protein J2T10_002752 [Paenarthrobacter nicotinovorans]|jgi:hypothetical protein|uniref:Uncharacterized protein n=1 Tax=Paenarthrobacter nicotinovorans TaxID=29320 RepID=A0ABT9TNX6_PAENI|nr:hypothetical protein [Paenarthrobacter nicotinovorans]
MIANPYQPYSQSVTVTRRQDVEPALQAAVDRAMIEAMVFPVRGILVTRHDHNSFTVTLSESVPFGTTLELDLRGAEDKSTMRLRNPSG